MNTKYSAIGREVARPKLEDMRFSNATGSDEYYNAFGWGNSKTEQLKRKFKTHFGSKKWRDAWEAYKKAGGDKDKLSKTWAEIEELYNNSEWKDKTEVGEFFAKSSRVAKKFNLAPIRAFALLFVKMNVFNLASAFKLAQMRTPNKYSKITTFWKNKLGGQPDALNKNVERGYKKKPLGGKKMDVDWSKTTNFTNADGTTKTLKFNSTILTTVPTLGAAVGTAIAAASGPGAAGGAALGGAVGGIASGLLSIVNGLNIPMGSGEGQPEGGGVPTDAEIKAMDLATLQKEAEEDAKDWAMPNWGWWTIGGTIATIATITTIILVNKFKK